MTTEILLLVIPATFILVMALVYSERVLPARGAWQWALAWAVLVVGALLRPRFLTPSLLFDSAFEPLVLLGALAFARRRTPPLLLVPFLALSTGVLLRGLSGPVSPVRVPEFPILPLLLVYAAWAVLYSGERPVVSRSFLSLALFTLAVVRCGTLLLANGLKPTHVLLWTACGMLTGMAQVFCLVDLLRHREERARRSAVDQSHALEAERTLLIKLLEYAPIGIWYTDCSGNLVLINQLARNYLSFDTSELVDHRTHVAFLETLRDRCSTPETLDKLAATIASAEPACEMRGTLRLVDDGDRERIFDVIVPPVLDGHGEGLSRMTILTETTDREEMERRLRESQKLDTVGTLAGGVAHDFNNQLQVVLTNLELSRAFDVPASVDSLLEAGLASARHCSQITTDLLTFSRVRVPDRTRLSVAPLLDETESLLRSTFPSSIELKVTTADRSLSVVAEPTEIQQIVMNLAINSRDALGGEGTIRIEVDGIHARERLTFQPGQDLLRIVVEDNGPGIPTTIRDRIFEPFFTSKEVGEGTGLGLATVHGIVTSLGGEIDVSESGGGGARFAILLPVEGPPSIEQTVLGSDPPPPPITLPETF